MRESDPGGAGPRGRLADDTADPGAGSRNGKPTVDERFEMLWRQILVIANRANLPRLKRSRAACLKHYKKLGSDRPEDIVISDYYEAGAASWEWRKDGGEFCPESTKIFGERRFLDGADSLIRREPSKGAAPSRPKAWVPPEERDHV